MKRISLWAVSTVSVLVLLFSHHTSTSSTMAATPTAAVISSQSGRNSGASASSAGDNTETDSDTTTQSSSEAPPTTVSGEPGETQWGPIEVQLTVANREITGVDVVQYPTGGRHDDINGRALPILVQETVDAQSADVDMVSGATMTSEAYLTSLQSAIDKAGL